MGLIRYKDGTWGVDYWIPAMDDRPRERKRHKVGTKTDAKNYLAEAQRAHRLGQLLPTEEGPKPKRRTIGEMLADYRDSRPRCQDTQRACDRWINLWGDRMPEEITPADIRKWVLSVVSPGTQIHLVVPLWFGWLAAIYLGRQETRKRIGTSRSRLSNVCCVRSFW